MMRVLPSTDKHGSKSAAPAVQPLKSLILKTLSFSSSLAESESISVAMQMLQLPLKATSTRLLSCRLNMPCAVALFYSLSTVCRLSAL